MLFGFFSSLVSSFSNYIGRKRASSLFPSSLSMSSSFDRTKSSVARIESEQDKEIEKEVKEGEYILRTFIKHHSATVPYISQSYSWDCGLACVEMVLLSTGIKRAALSEELRINCATDSIWTIDLAYLLQQYGVRCVFYTVNKGVRPEYLHQDFYRRQLTDDSKRVNRLFQNAEQRNVHVVQAPIQLADIQTELNNNKLIIILLDKRQLRCLFCDRSQRTKAMSDSSIYPVSGFIGHFIVLYAYYAPVDVFLVKDPAAFQDTCVIPAHRLEQARLAFGTDQDILIIDNVHSTNTIDHNGK